MGEPPVPLPPPHVRFPAPYFFPKSSGYIPPPTPPGMGPEVAWSRWVENSGGVCSKACESLGVGPLRGQRPSPAPFGASLSPAPSSREFR